MIMQQKKLLISYDDGQKVIKRIVKGAQFYFGADEMHPTDDIMTKLG